MFLYLLAQPNMVYICFCLLSVIQAAPSPQPEGRPQDGRHFVSSQLYLLSLYLQQLTQ